MIKEFEFYHGAALTRLIHSNHSISIRLYSASSNASYIINEKIGLYLKYSSQRMTPWRFSFHKDHQEEIIKIKETIGHVIIGLVCYDDGIVGLRYDEFKAIIDDFSSRSEWISATRKARQKYSIKGSDGKLRYKIGEGDYIQKILEAT